MGSSTRQEGGRGLRRRELLALVGINVEDHDSGDLGQLLHSSDEVLPLQPAPVRLHARQQLARTERVGNVIELGHEGVRGGQPVGIELVVHVVDRVSGALEQVRVDGPGGPERRDGRRGDGPRALEPGDQAADARGERTALREVLVVDVDPGDGVLRRERRDRAHGLRDPGARVRGVVPVHVSGLRGADELGEAGEADGEADVGVGLDEGLGRLRSEAGRPVRGEHAVGDVALGVGVDGEREREDVGDAGRERDVRELDGAAGGADVVGEDVAVGEQGAAMARPDPRCEGVAHPHDVEQHEQGHEVARTDRHDLIDSSGHCNARQFGARSWQQPGAIDWDRRTCACNGDRQLGQWRQAGWVNWMLGCAALYTSK